MIKHYLNEKGLSLIELLASIILISIISILLFSITTKAIENNRVISQETFLRDEADLIVSKLIKTMYSTKQENIIRNTTTSDGNSFLEISMDLSKCKKNEDGVLVNATQCEATLKPIGFKTANDVTKIHIFDETYAITNTQIKILSTSKMNGKPEDTSVYEVELKLSITHKRGSSETTKEMTFKNEIQPIINKK